MPTSTPADSSSDAPDYSAYYVWERNPSNVYLFAKDMGNDRIQEMRVDDLSFDRDMQFDTADFSGLDEASIYGFWFTKSGTGRDDLTVDLFGDTGKLGQVVVEGFFSSNWNQVDELKILGRRLGAGQLDDLVQKMAATGVIPATRADILAARWDVASDPDVHDWRYVRDALDNAWTTA